MKVNVVIIGAIRDFVDLFLIVQALDDARASGIIEQVVLSTWKGEFSECFWLKKLLTRSGVDIVESEPLVEGGVGNIYRQQRALYVGLLNINNTQIPVIKCRTDKCKSTLSDFLKYASLNRNLPFDESGVFSRKVAIEMASMTVPFLVADKVFLASHADALKLTFSADIYEKEFAFGKHLGAENRWFSNLFLLNHQYIRYYFGVMNFRAISTKVSNSINEKGIIEDEYLNFFGNYFVSLDQSFVFVRDASSGEEPRFNEGRDFLVEKRVTRSEIHIKNQRAMNFVVDRWGKQSKVDFSELKEFYVKNWLARVAITPHQKMENWSGGIFDVFPVSDDAKSILKNFWEIKGFSDFSASDIYYESACFLLKENRCLDDIILLLKRGFKSKNVACGKMLFDLNVSEKFLDTNFLSELEDFLVNRSVI